MRIPSSNRYNPCDSCGKEVAPEPGPSGVNIGAERAPFGISSQNVDIIRERTIFMMDLSILFGVFDEFLKCPVCGQDVTSHVDMRKNMDILITLFYSVIKACMTFFCIGKGHNAMITFNKVLNMPAPPRCDNCTKIQNQKLLPIVKQYANDRMLNNAMKVIEGNVRE